MAGDCQSQVEQTLEQLSQSEWLSRDAHADDDDDDDVDDGDTLGVRAEFPPKL